MIYQRLADVGWARIQNMEKDNYIENSQIEKLVSTLESKGTFLKKKMKTINLMLE